MFLNKEYKIERSDKYNIDLYKMRIPKEGVNAGKEVWDSTGHSWPTFPKACAGAIKIIGMDKITYQGDVSAVLEELSKVARMIDRISEDASKMAPRDSCVGCPVKLKVKNGK